MITVAVSGGFDPLHCGHVRYLKEAKSLGDELIVILNSDAFLKRKKKYVFMSFEERKEILEALKYVDKVVACVDEDQSVCKTLELLKPTIFAKGGDRHVGNIPEVEVCEKHGIQILSGIGGNDKPQSSSWLVNRFKEVRKD